MLLETSSDSVAVVNFTADTDKWFSFVDIKLDHKVSSISIY